MGKLGICTDGVFEDRTQPVLLGGSFSGTKHYLLDMGPWTGTEIITPYGGESSVPTITLCDTTGIPDLSYTTVLERRSLRPNPDGAATVRRVWFRFEGNSFDFPDVSVEVGMASTPNAVPTYAAAQTLTLGGSLVLNEVLTGSWFALRLKVSEDCEWAISDIQIEWTPAGTL